MPLNTHIETVQLTEGELRVVEDTTNYEVQVYHSMKPDPIAVFGFGDGDMVAQNQKEARIRGVEYSNGYARGEGGDE